MSDLTPLKEFLSQHPHIRHATPASPDFSSLRASYFINDALNPLMIVRPQSADDVAGLLSVFASHSIPFTIRTGGHDIFSRSVANDSVTIDMRDIAYASVDKPSLTARVGGGTLVGELAQQLAKEGVATPTGLIDAIGYVGWATHGGIGVMGPNYGLGVDQIVGAKIVNGQGKIVDADDKLLTGIRGGGGAFGVIVELTIKVYPLTHVLGGSIIFESEDLTSSYKQFNDGYRALSAEGLPRPLSIQQVVLNLPGGKGRAFGVVFLWSSSDLEMGDVWLKKICSLAPVAMNQVVRSTVSEWLSSTSALVVDRTYGTMLTVFFKKLTPEIVDVFATYALEMPADTGTMFNYHEVRGLPTVSYPETVYPERQPHFLTEILPLTNSPESLENLLKWAKSLQEALLKTDPENLLPTSYISFLDPEKNKSMREVFNDRYETLEELKRLYDPQNIFKFAAVRL